MFGAFWRGELRGVKVELSGVWLLSEWVHTCERMHDVRARGRATSGEVGGARGSVWSDTGVHHPTHNKLTGEGRSPCIFWVCFGGKGGGVEGDK